MWSNVYKPTNSLSRIPRGKNMSQQKSNRHIIVDSADLVNSNIEVPKKKSKEEKETLYFNRV